MNKRMSVPLARSLVEGELEFTSAGLALPAARTIVVQAEQIERLQNALQVVEEWGISVLETLEYVGIILPGDTEPTG